MMNRRGEMPTLVSIGLAFVLLLLVVTLLSGVTAQVLGAYRTSTLDGGDTVNNETNAAFRVLDSGLNGTVAFSSNMPTVGTMAGIGLVIAVVLFGLVALLVNKKGGGGLGGGGFG